MTTGSDKPHLSHMGPRGDARMVDISAKAITVREATASSVVEMRAEVLDALMSRTLPKGDALSAARIAGIQAAKRTDEWIPLCHSIPLDQVTLSFEKTAPGELTISCTAKATARTGVEMEALTGVAAASLTIYDMAKSADKAIRIGPIQLERKSGGRSGDFVRSTDS